MEQVRAFSITLVERKPLPIEKDSINFTPGKRTWITALPLAVFTHPAFVSAQEKTMSPEVSKAMQEFDDILWIIQLICGGLCVSVAVLMAMFAGFLRMLGLREEATRRYKDAAVGMLWVLTAPAAFGILATLTRALLRLFPYN